MKMRSPDKPEPIPNGKARDLRIICFGMLGLEI
jgi:hypothetical protein